MVIVVIVIEVVWTLFNRHDTWYGYNVISEVYIRLIIDGTEFKCEYCNSPNVYKTIWDNDDYNDYYAEDICITCDECDHTETLRTEMINSKWIVVDVMHIWMMTNYIVEIVVS